MMDRDELDFEDWAELFPGSYAVPDKNDISKDTAAEIALNGLYRCSVMKAGMIFIFLMSSAFRIAKFKGEDQKVYLAEIGNIDYPVLYNVALTTKSWRNCVCKKTVQLIHCVGQTRLKR